MMATRSLEVGAHGAPPLPKGRSVELGTRGTTFVRECGDRLRGPSLMLLHGLAATGSLNWFSSFPTLAREHHVVALDHRGHGRGIRDGRAFTLEDAADDVVALADALGIERFVPVGYSMGGPIAQLIWRRYPERVAGLVLCATAQEFRARPRERLMFASLPALELGTRVVPDLVSAGIMSLLAARYLATCDYAEWAQAELRRRDQNAVLQAAVALGGYSARAWIDTVDVPTAVVVHTRDQLVAPSRQFALSWRIPGATTHVVEADHFAPVRKPVEFSKTLARAVADVERRQAATMLDLAS
jgi:pimeloyl-ACP methyl ester carboxylesterase